MSGAFIYEYGDHGGLVVMADDVRKTKLVRQPKKRRLKMPNKYEIMTGFLDMSLTWGVFYIYVYDLFSEDGVSFCFILGFLNMLKPPLG